MSDTYFYQPNLGHGLPHDPELHLDLKVRHLRVVRGGDLVQDLLVPDQGLVACGLSPEQHWQRAEHQAAHRPPRRGPAPELQAAQSPIACNGDPTTALSSAPLWELGTLEH